MLCVIALIVSMSPKLPARASLEPLSYVYYEDEAAATAGNKSIGEISRYTVLESDSDHWEGSFQGSWFVVKDNVTINGRVYMKNKVNLLLCDGAKLTVTGGIGLNCESYNPDDSAILSIYCQEGGTGTLYAGTADGIECTSNMGPGIGGDHVEEAKAAIIISGGTITAIGAGESAGIGGGQEFEVRAITILGGTVRAIAGNGGAGIGGGHGHDGGTIRILGGTVTAISDHVGAAIGGGYEGDGGSIAILGGTVNAIGGYGIAIGSGNGGDDHGTLTLGTGMALFGSDAELPEQPDQSTAVPQVNGDYARSRYMKVLMQVPGGMIQQQPQPGSHPTPYIEPYVEPVEEAGEEQGQDPGQEAGQEPEQGPGQEPEQDPDQQPEQGPGKEPSDNKTPAPKLKATLKNGRVALKWTGIPDAERYRIYQKVGGKFRLIKTTKKPSLTISKALTRTGKKEALKPGKKYVFAVRACVEGKWTRITKKSKITVKTAP